MTIFNSFLYVYQRVWELLWQFHAELIWWIWTYHFGYFGKQGQQCQWLFGSEQSNAFERCFFGAAAAHRGMASGEQQISWSPCGGGFLWSLFFGLWTNQQTNLKFSILLISLTPVFSCSFNWGKELCPKTIENHEGWRWVCLCQHFGVLSLYWVS